MANILQLLCLCFCATVTLSVGTNLTSLSLSLEPLINQQGVDVQNISESLPTTQDMNSLSNQLHVVTINQVINQLAILTIMEESKEHFGGYLSNVTELVEGLRNEVQLMRSDLGTLQSRMASQDVTELVEGLRNEVQLMRSDLGTLQSRMASQDVTGLVEGLRNEVQHVRANFRTLQSLTALQAEGQSFFHEGRVFYVNAEKQLTWQGAHSWCQQWGTVLAQPKRNLNSFIQMVNSRVSAHGMVRVWLGANDIAKEGEWKWLSGGHVNHQNIPWVANNPSNTHNNEDCMEILIRYEGNNVINDHQCHYGQHFVCELPHQ